MKVPRTFFLVLSLAFLAALLSCVNVAKFTIDHPVPIFKSQFTNVVVVPIPAINRLEDKELLAGERAYSDFVERVFKSTTCQVVRADRVRKDLNIAAYDTSVSLANIAQFYKPDGIIWIEFNNLRRSGGWGNAANGYIEGDIKVHLLDKAGHPLLNCTGYVHAETGFGLPPGFDTMISRGLNDLQPKLLAVLQ
jgi:hypothetical protein